MKREIKVLLVTLLLAVVLVVGLFVLKSVTTPEQSEVTGEVAVEEGGSGVGAGGVAAGGEREKIDLSKKKKVDSKQGLLDAIYDEKQGKQMKDHLKAISESSR